MRNKHYTGLKTGGTYLKKSPCIHYTLYCTVILLCRVCRARAVFEQTDIVHIRMYKRKTILFL